MEWYNTDKIPEIGKRVVVVYSSSYNGEVSYRTFVGTFTKFCTNESPYSFKLKLTDTSKSQLFMHNIQAWAYEQYIVNEAVRTANERPLEVYCPHCREKLEVIAELHNITFAEIPILENTLTNRTRLGWESINSESDLKYVCKECRKKLSSSFEELVNLTKKEVKSFANDPDKVRDLLLLSKEEFLKRHTHITEEEYDATVEVLKENIGKKGK